MSPGSLIDLPMGKSLCLGLLMYTMSKLCLLSKAHDKYGEFLSCALVIVNGIFAYHVVLCIMLYNTNASFAERGNSSL